MGEDRRCKNIPTEYVHHDDVIIPEYGLPPTENIPFSRGQRARQSIRRDVDPPRASCDAFTHPPVWSDYEIRPHMFPDTYIPIPSPLRPSTQAGPSSFTPSRSSFSAFNTSMGFDTYSNPGPSFQPFRGTSSFAHFTSGFPSFTAGVNTYSSSDFTTPSTDVFAPFQAQSSGTLSNLQQHNISSMRSRMDDDDDNDNDEDDNGDEEESEDNQRQDNEVQVSHERNTNRRIPFIRRLLPHRNRRRPGCGT